MSKQATILSSIITVCLTVIVLFAIYTGGQHRTVKRSFQAGRDRWQVEYQYLDCWIVERYELVSRDFRPLYPHRTPHESVRRWNLEHPEDNAAAMPPAAQILLPAANPEGSVDE